MTVDGPAPSGQREFVRTQQILCGVALLLFAAFFWSRSLHWSYETITHVEVVGNEGFNLVRDAEGAFAGSEWDLIDNTIWIFGALLVIPNLLYLFAPRVVDQLIPALANSGVGALLSALTLYFIFDPAAAMSSAAHRGNLTFIWSLRDGVYVALVLAVLILGVGLAQGVVRAKAERLAAD